MSPPPLSLGISPCPNDTFAFHALLHGKVKTDLRLSPTLEDVEALNQRALAGSLDVTKISFSAFFQVAHSYALLSSGAALGFGCGPLLVTRDPELDLAGAAGVRLAVPGLGTTATLLLRLCLPEATELLPMPFDAVLPALEQGRADAGLIIHELRFTYQDLGYRKLVDLGEWWEAETGCPIPLGAILARRDLGPEVLAALSAAVRDSVLHARAHPDEALPFMAAHAQDMDPAVMRSHVELYVNDFTVDLGREGADAIRALHTRGAAAGLLPPLEPELLQAVAP